MGKRLQLNNIICRVEKIKLPIKKGVKLQLKYRGCTVCARRTHCVIFVGRKQIREVFTLINFAQDFSECLFDFFGVKKQVVPRICNIQASKVLNISRNEKELKQFLIRIHQLIEITDLSISREGASAFEQINLQQIFQTDNCFGLFIAIQVKGAGFSGHIQSRKDKQRFVGSFIFTKYTETIRKLFGELNLLY